MFECLATKSNKTGRQGQVTAENVIIGICMGSMEVEATADPHRNTLLVCQMARIEIVCT